MSVYPLIAVVTDYSDNRRNEILSKLLNKLMENYGFKKILEKYWLIFTGGTFSRIFEGLEGKDSLLTDEAKDFYLDRTVRLPNFDDGGVTILSYLIKQNYCTVMWSFQTPNSPHHLVAQNNYLRRMCDLSQTKRLVNTGSVIYWLENNAMGDYRNCEGKLPLISIDLKSGTHIMVKQPNHGPRQEINARDLNKTCDQRERFLAIIVRKNMVADLNKFLHTYSKLMSSFNRILITNSTDLKTDFLQNVTLCETVSAGGLIEISMEVLFGKCDDLILFDPLDIPDRDAYANQIILNACKRDQNIRVITNKDWAEEWAKTEISKMETDEYLAKPRTRIFVENATTLTELTEMSYESSEPVFVSQNPSKIYYNSNQMEIDKMYTVEWEGMVIGIKKNKDKEIEFYEMEDDHYNDGFT